MFKHLEVAERSVGAAEFSGKADFCSETNSASALTDTEESYIHSVLGNYHGRTMI